MVSEIQEETRLAVTVDKIVDSWIYSVRADRKVLVVNRCVELDEVPEVAISSEHRAGRWVPIGECASYKMPSGYLRSIRSST